MNGTHGGWRHVQATTLRNENPAPPPAGQSPHLAADCASKSCVSDNGGSLEHAAPPWATRCDLAAQRRYATTVFKGLEVRWDCASENPRVLLFLDVNSSISADS